MLIETVKRYDPKNALVKFVSIDTLRLRGKSVPPQIHSVPALVTMPSKQVLYGKNVFDYLLLPTTGALFQTAAQEQPPAQNADIPVASEPLAFTLTNGMSDSFASFDESNETSGVTPGFMDRSYTWSAFGADPIDEQLMPPGGGAFQEETRVKKNTIDLDTYRIQRDLDLKQNDLNTSPLPPPSTGR